MAMSLPAGEPAAGPWRAASVSELVELLVATTNKPSGRPLIIAVDGRSASGKSSLAACLHQQVARSAIVLTDDVAWHESFFGWSPLLAEDVLEPLRRGEPVTFRPPAWAQYGRGGAILLPAGLDLVVIEGVGAGQRELSGLIDATIWVQSDFVEAEQRGIARDIAHGTNGDPAQTITFWHKWMAEELPFLAADRPWERACVVVAGSPTIPLGPDQFALALS
jgi:pantothenate kinase